MIVIVDYGMGNLRSVQKGLEKVGHEGTISGDPADLRRATKVILPGVGGFADAMAELHRRKLVEPLREAIDAGKPFLGVCLGMQLLFETGEEGGRHEGLGVLAGEVARFKVPREFKVPHMGWNRLNIRRPTPLTVGLSPGPFMYFVHSYYVMPRDPNVIACETQYHRPFTSVICRDRLFACQFHPEKSQADGLRLLRNFAAL
jgi:imidazole glycerol-phosphate synthase subunit HisH